LPEINEKTRDAKKRKFGSLFIWQNQYNLQREFHNIIVIPKKCPSYPPIGGNQRGLSDKINLNYYNKEGAVKAQRTGIMRLKKYRGQHLLADRNMLLKIVESAHIGKNDNIIEIGAGTGLLTTLLAERAGRVISFEIEREMKNKLRKLENHHSNLTVRMEDFLKWDMTKFLEEDENRWRVVANIPYNITSPILEKLMKEGRKRLIDAYILMQKEVARRIISPPGTREYGRISVFVRYFAESEILFDVPPEVFIPPPKVDSSLLHIKFGDVVFFEDNKSLEKLFFMVVKASFSQRRKQIHKAIRGVIPGLSREQVKKVLEESGIDPKRRGETLDIQEFKKLAESFIDSGCMD